MHRVFLISPRASAALMAVLAASITSVVAQPAIPEANRVNGFAIGCQAYTFNRFTVFEAIEKTAQAGGKIIEFYPGQTLSKEAPSTKWDHNASEDVVAKVKAKLQQHGIKAVNYGVVGIPNDESEARKIFTFAKTMGMRAVTTESADAINLIEKLAKEYDIAVGFHNHPGSLSDPNYKIWSPYYVAGLVQGRDARLGSAADTGHWTRSGVRAVDALRVLKGRIVSAHLKDLNEFGRRDAHDVPFGTGKSEMKACLDELKAQGFDGNISIEYEHNWDNSVPEVTQCIDFVRQYGK